MNILILYASAGRGHRVAAEALHEEFLSRYPGNTVRLVDILEYTPGWFRFFYSGGYALVATSLPSVWFFLYSLTRCVPFCALFRCLCIISSPRARKFIRLGHPDVVISTHFLGADIAAHLKKQALLSARLFTVITDFGVHPLWMNRYTDTYIVASEPTAERLRRSGVGEEKIKVFGIPLRTRMEEHDARQPGGPCALLMTGSFGFSYIENVVAGLKREISLIVVCGQNRSLKERLSPKEDQRLKVYGFTDEISRIMSQVDLIVTKPGGLTIAEALAKELPMIFIPGIPGQESENARIMVASGCAFRAGSLRSLKRIIARLMNEPGIAETMKKNIRALYRPHATDKICSYVCSRCSGIAD